MQAELGPPELQDNRPDQIVGHRALRLRREGRLRHADGDAVLLAVGHAGVAALEVPLEVLFPLLRQLAGDRVVVRTAGSEPAGEVRHTVVAVLDEIGVPLAGEFPKPLTDESVRAADVIVTMGCGDACPVYPGRRYFDWDLEDPVGKPIERVRAIRDDIDGRVRRLLAELVH